MKIKKIFLFLMVFTIALSAAGCKNDSDSGENKTNSVEYTEYVLANGKTSDYRIVIPQESSKDERLAAEEMNLFIEQSTQAEVSVVTDSAVSYSPDAKLIILGNTAFTDNSGIDVSAIKDQGFVIKTVGSNVFILGAGRGVLYGAYEFLSREVGFEAFAYDCYYVDDRPDAVYIGKFDLSDSPDIYYRCANWGVQRAQECTNRMRLINMRDVFMRWTGDVQHNFFDEFFPKGKYGAAHKEWYAGGDNYTVEDSRQLCLTAHGDEESLAEMRSVALERMKAIIRNWYNTYGELAPCVNFSQEDYNTWCPCSACTALKNKYGTDSASAIIFLNPIAEELDRWVEENYPGNKVKIAFFAYHKTEAAPVKKVGNTYEPIDEQVKLNENLAAYVAPIYANYIYPVTHQKNRSLVDLLDQWSAVSSTMYVWPYDTNFSHFLAYYDTTNSMQGLYRLLKEKGAEFVFNQAQYPSTTTLTGFDIVRAYLESKLAWNVDADLKTLTENFFNAYFGEAAGPMLTYYNAFRSWEEYLRSNMNIEGGVNATISKTHYPKQLLLGWYNYIEQAYAAIGDLKNTDIGAYQRYYDRICAEGIAIRAHLLVFYADTYVASELQQMRVDFKYDAERLGFTNYKETGTLEDELYKSWGLV